MSSEIEDFLRRAAAKRRQQAQTQAPIQYVEPDVVEPEIIEAEPLHEGVASHVGRHLDTSGFQQRASHLGDRVEMADEQMDQKIHEKFDHDVGRLHETPNAIDATYDVSAAKADAAYDVADATPYVVEDTTQSLAAQIRSSLTKPQTVRQAIILSEILRRPE